MATPVPPPSPRHLRLLRLLLSGLVLGAAFRGAAAGRPDVATCPGSLDCALKRRARCPPGAHVCGPCLQPFREDPQGLCVPRRQRQPPAATLGLSEHGRGPDLGLSSTPGASSPTPRTSLGSMVSSGSVHMSPLEPRHGDGLALALILAFSMVGVAALAMAALCWCRLQRDIRLTQKADYTAPQAPGSPATPRISQPGDQRLAHSAEMYHYQHQRQQMRCLERHKEPPKELESVSSDEENEDGDFTVYECPGLAPTGEMEVRNPLFDHASLSAPPLQ
ncbi:neural proliferation differentiation and control protein 1 isoform X4 [Camelus ferus]|uniref:Neural proliferation differentiation and control protein 1 isoform X4 n=2 Tax=Camelus TaxID=9836 RepID=A0A8B8SYZ1_CAMFR|nr:neural proliferation differentiation and control protein 1 isoform X4 [Camelus ferus]